MGIERENGRRLCNAIPLKFLLFCTFAGHRSVQHAGCAQWVWDLRMHLAGLVACMWFPA